MKRERRGPSVASGTNGHQTIKLNDKASGQVQGLLDSAQKIQEQLNVYVNALGAALDVPDGWQLDPVQMAFVPPLAPPPVPGTQVQEADHEPA
jgi:hypothetical protein